MKAVAKLTDSLGVPVEPAQQAGSRGTCIAFVGDAATREVVSAACQQLYPALSIREGGSREAVEYLAEGLAPDMLIVDVTDAAKPLTAMLPILAAFEQTKVIAFGTANDIVLYRDMIEAGVQDYLLKPVTEKALVEALDRIEAKAAEAKAAAAAVPTNARRPIIAVMGTRGGVGASTVAINCAWILAEEEKAQTTLLDLDLQHGTIALALDIEPTRGLREALQNPGRIDSLFISSMASKVTDRLMVLASEEGVDDELRYDDSAVALLLDELHRQSECIIVDVPRAAAGARARVLSQASDVVVVTDLTLAGLRDAIRTFGIVQSVAPSARVFFVANRSDAKANNVSKAEFEKALGRSIDLVVPEDAKGAAAAANAGKPLATAAPRSKAVAALQELAKKLHVAETPKKRSFWRRSK